MKTAFFVQVESEGLVKTTDWDKMAKEWEHAVRHVLEKNVDQYCKNWQELDSVSAEFTVEPEDMEAEELQLWVKVYVEFTGECKHAFEKPKFKIALEKQLGEEGAVGRIRKQMVSVVEDSQSV